MSAAHTVARMLTLIPWLLERPGATVAEAAAAFGVDRRTILADLDTLGYCGLPGLGGGDLFEVSVVDDRILVEIAHQLDQPLRLNPREALRLVLIGEAVAAALGEELPALRSALDRIRAAAGIPTGVAVQMEDDLGGWLSRLRDAITAGRQVLLSYRGRGDQAPTQRVVHPWELQVTEGAWYVLGFDQRSGETRTFRLDRIAAVEVLDRDATLRPAGFELPAPMYEPGPADLEVVLHLAPEVRWVAEQLRSDRMDELEDGGRRVVFHTDAPRWVIGLVLGAGPGASILRPAWLAEQVREEAAATLARYGRPARRERHRA